MTNRFLNIAAIILLAIVPAHAVTVDQSFLSPETGGARIGGTSIVATTGSANAQTFTAGLTGTLDSAIIVLASFTDTTTDVSLSLYSVDGGGTPLSELGTAFVNTATLLTPGVSTQVTYDFSSLGLMVTAGTQYALVAIHGEGIGTSWRADPDGAGYVGGQRWSTTYDTVAGTFGSWGATPTWDFLFETRVATTPVGSPVPEPITATLGLMGLGVLGYTTRRRTA